MDEHKRDIEKKKEISNVFEHINNNDGHSFNFSEVKVLDRSDNKIIRRRLEGIYTHKEINSLNRAWEFNLS